MQLLTLIDGVTLFNISFIALLTAYYLGCHLHVYREGHLEIFLHTKSKGSTQILLKVSLLGIVVGLMWSNDPEGYTGGSIATGRVFHASQIDGDYSDKIVIPWSSRLGFGCEAYNLVP